MYNLFSFSNSQKVKEILSLGHEVGLHFDASLYSTDDLNHLDDLCRSECEILEKWFKFKINFISFHRPIKKFQGLKRKINGKSHSYEPRFFNEMIYCSDSKGDWHHGYPLEKLKEHPKRAIQLLTHPIWWDSEKNIDPVNKLDEFVIKHINEFCEEVKNNCVTFKKSKLIDKFKKLPYQ